MTPIVNLKNEKYNKVCLVILEIIASKGLAALTISAISKKASVSRPWIYQYMGNNKEDLLRIAAESCAIFFGRSYISVELNSREELISKICDAAKFSIEACIAQPIYIETYFRHKGSQNIFGATIEKFESLWMQKFSKHLVRVLKVSPSEAKRLSHSLLILRLGYCFDLSHRRLKPQELQIGLDELLRLQKATLGLLRYQSTEAT